MGQKSKIALIILFGFFLTQSLFGQENKSIIIYGSVIDNNNKAISFTNIIAVESQKGTAADIEGEFLFRIFSNQTIIEFSHVGYNTFTYNVNEDLFSKNDSLKITIRLTKKLSELSSVDINSDKTELVHGNNNIYDFEFIGNNILLLKGGFVSNELLLLDEDSDTLSVLEIPKSPQRLIKDCFDNIHIIYKDSIRQIYIDEDDFMYTLYTYSIDDYYKYLSSAIISIDSTLIVLTYSENKQSESYYYIDSSKEFKLLLKITDEENNKSARTELNSMHNFKGVAKGLIERSVFASSREIFERRSFYKFILTQAIYNPIFKIQDSLYLFNHINKTCLVFDHKLQSTRAISLNYVEDDNWDKEILNDIYTNKVYAKFNNKGKVILKEIDLNTGNIIKEYKLENCIFPNKIVVNNGYIFFTKRKDEDSGQMRIFKQKLN